MTREEAKKTIMETSKRFHTPDGMTDCLIDTYVALGMLKLDEPKSAEEKAREAVEGLIRKIIGGHTSKAQADCIFRALKNAKIF